VTLPVLRFTNLQAPHAVSTRHGGRSAPPYASLNLAGRVGDDPEAVRYNREVFLGLIGHKPETAVGVRQVHGNRVVVATLQDAGRGVTPEAAKAEEGDALIICDPGIALIVLGADCTPVLLWDPVRKAAGAAHAGWRGTVAGVANEVVRAMGETFGSRPEDIRAGIAPAIGRCCYEVDAAVEAPLREHHPAIADRVLQPGRPGHWMLDLQEANRLQLLAAGLQQDHIEVLALCTSCRNDLLYSQRVEGYPCGRFAAAIALP
jgi:YfiH family protein